jgi:hypothetical protein
LTLRYFWTNQPEAVFVFVSQWEQSSDEKKMREIKSAKLTFHHVARKKDILGYTDAENFFRYRRKKSEHYEFLNKNSKNWENVPNFSTAASSMPLKIASAKGGVKVNARQFLWHGGGGGGERGVDR